ncbi:NAD(P)/FAD-dependent oxidoreductase [Desulfotalea psychrophila]|uniref:Related to opine oxidase, subunit B n=1 Tax=Desulfotalea psychrophila (strain LSv54 / DSM 12343) TaxID=177439 RepID=Q6AR03_DESPS|nr:FAD-binding oxidoreductase [Desulfotalea psychrophila]CAG35221.1 related to opine oxidase, subunit B [Desulfotalea psychrophila LSv54]
MKKVDIIVIGGGLQGASTALGLVREGAGKVLMFDEQLPTQRLSRGNFGLTWFMCKGANNPNYAKWCRMATTLWPEFAAKLEEETGYDVELEWNGGALHATSGAQFQMYSDAVANLKKVCSDAGMDYPARMVDREEFASMVPKMKLGDEVVGAMYSADQGTVNPMGAMAAMRAAFQKKGGVYYGGMIVTRVVPNGDGTVTVKTSKGDYQCSKLVIAAGHGSSRLLEDLDYHLNVYPTRGQIMVSERIEKKLDFPTLAVRQTLDGTFLIGLSTEDFGHNSEVTTEAMKNQAAGAIKLFPELGKVNWVRGWGAARVMTPDGSPIYDRLTEHKNIYVLAGHSAVSLAPVSATHVAPWILEKAEAPQISHFSNGRFNV